MSSVNRKEDTPSVINMADLHAAIKDFSLHMDKLQHMFRVPRLINKQNNNPLSTRYEVFLDKVEAFEDEADLVFNWSTTAKELGSEISDTERADLFRLMARISQENQSCFTEFDTLCKRGKDVPRSVASSRESLSLNVKNAILDIRKILL